MKSHLSLKETIDSMKVSYSLGVTLVYIFVDDDYLVYRVMDPTTGTEHWLALLRIMV
jgi:hypothetical protein